MFHGSYLRRLVPISWLNCICLSVLNCCWPSPAQSFLASGLTNTFDQDFISSRHVCDWEWVTLRLAIYRQSVCLGSQRFFFTEPFLSQSLCNIISDERTCLSFTIAVGPCQRSHSRVWVPRDSSHFTVSDSRLPQLGGPGPCIYIPQEQDGPVLFSSSPTTRRATVEVFGPASTRELAVWFDHTYMETCMFSFVFPTAGLV
jgi:hypothetical protein